MIEQYNALRREKKIEVIHGKEALLAQGYDEFGNLKNGSHLKDISEEEDIEDHLRLLLPLQTQKFLHMDTKRRLMVTTRSQVENKPRVRFTLPSSYERRGGNRSFAKTRYPLEKLLDDPLEFTEDTPCPEEMPTVEIAEPDPEKETEEREVPSTPPHDSFERDMTVGEWKEIQDLETLPHQATDDLTQEEELEQVKEVVGPPLAERAPV